MCSHKRIEHGYGYMDQQWETPRRILTSNHQARPGYTSKRAHEYEDVEEVLLEKVKELARLMKLSKKTLLYTGAGISTAAGLGDYASAEHSENNVPVWNNNNNDSTRKQKKPLRSLYDAEPTECHRVLTDVCHKKFDLVQYWVQQNHDGLPQKAGFPQHLMNETKFTVLGTIRPIPSCT